MDAAWSSASSNNMHAAKPKQVLGHPNMDSSEWVRVEIEQLAGEVALELKLHIRASEIEARAAGSNLTWSAKGIRIVVPSGAVDGIRKAIARLAPEAEEH